MKLEISIFKKLEDKFKILNIDLKTIKNNLMDSKLDKGEKIITELKGT